MSSGQVKEKTSNSVSEDFIREAVRGANVSCLRAALYHETKDPDLLSMEIVERSIRGGALKVYRVPREHHEVIREKAVQYLLSGASPLSSPTREEAGRLIEMFTGQKPNKVELDYGYEELSFDETPRDAIWHNKPDQSVIDDFTVTIVGSGFSGIAAAIQLERLGIKYRIIERHADLGGTWLINNYPEARVDVSTFLYQYKFEKNYPWKSYYAPRDELREYANFIVDKYSLRDKMSFNRKLNSAKWDENDNKWTITVELPDGSTETIVSNAIISACGLFNTPKRPDIPGIEKFKGEMFHTTEWNHSFDYAGKKVCQIGTGSTGLQLARGVAQKAGHLTIFQRTASWVTPVKGYHAELTEHKRWMLDNMPGYNNWFVFLNYHAELQMQEFQEIDPEWVAKGGRVNEKNANFRKSLIDGIKQNLAGREDLIEKLIPKPVPMARRMVIDNDWYATVMRENVSLVSDGIQEITKDGVIDGKGELHKCDLIVLSTGFDVSRYLIPAHYEGIDGIRLEDLWDKDGARAFKGLALPGFPNFFMMYGPNGQARIGSFHSWAENFSRYMCALFVHMLETGSKSVAVKRAAYDKYNADMDEAMKSLLWETETGNSYYLNNHGRSGVNMPWDVHDYFAMIQHIDPENYDIS